MATQNALLANLTPEELTAVALLAQRVRESAQLVVRNKLEDAAVRISRKNRWCDDFRVNALRVIGAPRGPRVAWRFDRTGKSMNGARIEYRDSDGVDCDGYDVNGWFNGFGPDGFNAAGIDADGFNRDGVDADGLVKWRFDASGWDRDGFNSRGLDREGYTRTGYSSDGFDREGFNRDGLDYRGRDREGFDSEGLNRAGVRRDGTDRFGLNPFRFNTLTGLDADGFNRDGWNPTTRVQRVDAPTL